MNSFPEEEDFLFQKQIEMYPTLHVSQIGDTSFLTNNYKNCAYLHVYQQSPLYPFQIFVL